MKKNIFLCSLICVGLLLTAIACKKKKKNDMVTPQPDDPTCKITTIGHRNLSDSSSYIIHYDSQDRIASIDITGTYAQTDVSGKEVFNYKDKNTVIITATTPSGALRRTDSITLTDEGWLKSLYRLRGDGTHETVTGYFDENKKFLYLVDDKVDVVDTTYFHFENGNLMETTGTDDNRNGKYTYYDLVIASAGDGNQMQQFLEFRFYFFKSVNLLKTLTIFGGLDVTVSYTTDNEGKIKSSSGLTPLSAKPAINTTFDYTCD